MELDGHADGKRFVRDDGRGVVVVPDKISPLLHQAREVVLYIFHELRGDGRAGHGEALRERAENGQMTRICADRTAIERGLVTEVRFDRPPSE